MSVEAKASKRDDRRLIGAAVIGLGVVILDRTVKGLTSVLLDRGAAWPGDGWPVRLVHVVNTGAAFGMLQGQTSLLTVASAIGILVFAYLLLRRPGRTMYTVGLSLGLGGAMANFIDRVTTGQVVDSLKVDYWPAFNLADVALTLGIALLLWANVPEGGGKRDRDCAARPSDELREPEGGTPLASTGRCRSNDQ